MDRIAIPFLFLTCCLNLPAAHGQAPPDTRWELNACILSGAAAAERVNDKPSASNNPGLFLPVRVKASHRDLRSTQRTAQTRDWDAAGLIRPFRGLHFIGNVLAPGDKRQVLSTPRNMGLDLHLARKKDMHIHLSKYGVLTYNVEFHGDVTEPKLKAYSTGKDEPRQYALELPGLVTTVGMRFVIG